MLRGRVLITGGTGTLGQAIVQEALDTHQDCTFTIYSRSEHRQALMASMFPKCRFVLGDIRDEAQLRAAVAGHDLVIHAAAMKRIPECEAQPAECLATNVQGSLNVVRACIAGRVARCVGISTDKACAAITTYGASKRAMEGIFMQQERGVTQFTLVRYGNVVASNGSVIPLWRKQMMEQRPLTITGRGITRFWMSKLDAVRLIHLAAHSNEGTIVIPKMGALSVEGMAHIVAPGAELMDVPMRSCEKTHEDLVHPDESGYQTATHFMLRSGQIPAGFAYTSANAPRITPDEFRTMLELA